MIQIPGLNELRRAARTYDLARSAYSKGEIPATQLALCERELQEANDAYQRLNRPYK